MRFLCSPGSKKKKKKDRQRGEGLSVRRWDWVSSAVNAEAASPKIPPPDLNSPRELSPASVSSACSVSAAVSGCPGCNREVKHSKGLKGWTQSF